MRRNALAQRESFSTLHGNIRLTGEKARGELAAGRLNALSRSMTNNTVSGHKCLPDTEICRTGYVMQSDLSQCLVESPDTCPYATRFGSGVICRHPDRRRFEKTDSP